MSVPLLIPIALEIAKLTAPHVARWLGGDNAATAAERIIDTASSVVGAGSPQEVLDRLRADAALQAATAVKMAELDASLEQAYLNDRADARARDVAIQKGGRRNYRADIMLAMAFAGVAFISWLMLSYRVDGGAAVGGFLIGVGGALVKMIGDAFAFEFGSSRSSKDKEAIIATVVRNGQS